MNNNKLLLKMIEYNAGDPERGQHSLKVYTLSKLIGEMEQLDTKTQLILETAAILHDVGIRYCEQQFGEQNGKMQEKHGPDVAKAMLEELGYDEETIQRVCFLIAHHHTYKDIEDMDYQILIEADFIVNLYEENVAKESAPTVLSQIFKTETGKRILCAMFEV